MANGHHICSEDSRGHWPESFLEDRNPAEEETFLEARRRLNPNDDSLLCFLRDYDDNTAEEEVITRFCTGGVCANIRLPTLTDPRACPSRRAWLDDRLWISKTTSLEEPVNAQPKKMGLDSERSNTTKDECRNVSEEDIHKTHPVDHKARLALPTLTFREYQAPLDASTLLSHLRQKRFSHTHLPDADRRLIYVSGLTPAFVYTLIETATQHQAAALKTALYRHISRQTDIGVKLSYSKYDIFELYLNIPFYTLRTPGDVTAHEDGFLDSAYPQQFDLSFLIHSDQHDSTDSSQILQLGHISINICGVANRRWTGYAFIDCDEEMSEDDFDYTAMVPDQFALNCEGGFDARYPKWDPREYFLLVSSLRIGKVVNKWTWLIQQIASGNSKTTTGPANAFDYDKREDKKVTFKRTQEAVRILGVLHDMLSETNEAWIKFAVSGEDIMFFEDTLCLSEESQKNMKRCLLDLKNKFRKLHILQGRLETLERQYQRGVKSFERRLAMENNIATISSGDNTELMVSWVSPVAIVSAVFAIPAPFGGFERNGRSFTLAMVIVTLVIRSLIFIQRKGWRPQLLWSYLMRKREIRQEEIEIAEQPNHRRRIPSRMDTADTLVEPGV